MQRLGTPFAVVDVETTGLFPHGHDRVIEVAVVEVAPAGEVGPAWSTLVNPGRDLGPTTIHGIRGRDVVGAPRFTEIVGDLCERLAGRVLVAHNARFDREFLAAELARCGFALPPSPWLCTMRLGSALVGSRRLQSCCDALDIDLAHAHTAADDAWASAEILAEGIRQGALTEPLANTLAGTPMPPVASWPSVSATGRRASRGAEPPARGATHLGRLIDRLPQSAAGCDGADAEYLALLDRVLEDRRGTEEEAESLWRMADSWGLGRAEVRALHERYLADLAAAAWRDKVVTDAERADLLDAGRALGVSAETAKPLLATPPDRPERSPRDATNGALAGLSVCFTGALSCTRTGRPISRTDAEALAAEHGLLVRSGVSKRLDLLVLADPDSLSGKAQKARRYGTRLMVERSFWTALGVQVD